MSGWLSDVRFGLRLLRRNPEVTTIAVLAMAIAIGVAGTVFSVANAVLIQPLPFSQPERLVAVWQVDPANTALWRPVAAGNYADWQRMSQSFERLPVSRLGWPISFAMTRVMASLLLNMSATDPLTLGGSRCCLA